MNTQHTRPWPAIDVAELRYGLAFGSSVEEIADFLQRDVDDVRHQIEVEAHKTAQVPGSPPPGILSARQRGGKRRDPSAIKEALLGPTG